MTTPMTLDSLLAEWQAAHSSGTFLGTTGKHDLNVSWTGCGFRTELTQAASGSSKEQLEHGPGGVGGFLRDGTPIPLHVARMLASDAARVDVTLGDDGEILDVGRRTRTIPSAIARALWLRDGGCRVPGCDRKRHLHAHHIHHWAQGGPTRLSNLVLVCSGHHRMIHEEQLFSEIRDRKFVFLDRSRSAIPHSPPSAATGRELEEIDRFLQDGNLNIEPNTNCPRWDGTPMHLGESLDWMLMAHTPPDPAELNLSHGSSMVVAAAAITSKR